MRRCGCKCGRCHNCGPKRGCRHFGRSWHPCWSPRSRRSCCRSSGGYGQCRNWCSGSSRSAPCQQQKTDADHERSRQEWRFHSTTFLYLRRYGLDSLPKIPSGRQLGWVGICGFMPSRSPSTAPPANMLARSSFPLAHTAVLGALQSQRPPDPRQLPSYSPRSPTR